MTYEEAIEWLSSFADFERSGRFRDRPDVAPMLALLERLGNPHVNPLRYTFHIAGSKGKGSIAAMIESIQRADGMETGLYTSPHLYDYTERIQVEGEPISRDSFASLAAEIRSSIEAETTDVAGRTLVTFDVLTAIGFLAFARADVQVQVVEVGLGGRVDSTNVFTEGQIVIISPISLEHAAILGGTVEKIAVQKAGIITPTSTVVLAPQEYPEVAAIVAEAANLQCVNVQETYRWQLVTHDLRSQTIHIVSPQRDIKAKLRLLGRHQIENAATAVAAVDALHGYDPRYWPLEDTIAQGLANVRWPCRIEVLRERPLVIADGAHNRDSARRLVETLVDYFVCGRALFIVGCSSDKDIEGLAEELAPIASRAIAVRADHPRAMAPERIAEAFGRLNVDTEIGEDVAAAVERAMATTGESGLICVAGSLFVAAEARAQVLGVKSV